MSVVVSDGPFLPVVPNTRYLRGQIALAGSVAVQAKATFVTGLAGYVPSDWDVLAEGVPGGTGGSVDLSAYKTAAQSDATYAPVATTAVTLKASADPTDNIGRLNAALAAGTPVRLSRGASGEHWWTNAPISAVSGSTIVLGAGVAVKLMPRSNCWLFSTANQDGSRISNVSFIGERGSWLKPQHGALLAADAASGATTLTLDRHPGTDLTYPVQLYLGESYDSNRELVTVNSVTGSGPYTATLAAATTLTHTVATTSWLASQARNQGNRYLSAVLQPINVDRLRLGGYRIHGGNFVTVNPQGCTEVDIFDIDLAADDVTPNQDGIDPFGCSNVRIHDISGHTGDDFAYVMSQVTTPAVHPVLRAGGASPMGNTSNVSFSNINVDPSGNGIRLIAGDGLEVHDVRGTNVNFPKTGNGPRLGTGKFCALRMGTSTVSGPAVVPTAAQFGNVRMQITSKLLRGLLLDYPCNDVALDWTTQTATQKLPALDRENTITTTHSRIRVVEHSTDNAAVADGSVQSVAVVPANTTIDGLDLEVDTSTITNLLSNAGVVTGLKVRSVHAKRQVGDLFTGTLSALAGDVNNVTIDTVVSGATLAAGAGAAALRFGPQTPVLTSADATPLAVKGSQITCDSSKNPVGDATAGGGLYYGTGALWVRLASDLVTPVAPTATALSGRNVIVWGDLGYSSYKVYRSDAPTTSLGTTATRSFVDATATTGTAYTYTYEPLDGTGAAATAKSAASNSVTALALTLVVNDTMTDTNGTAIIAHTGEAGATWAKHPTGNAGPVIDGTSLYQAGAAASNHYASGSPAADSWVSADWVFKSFITGSTAGIYGRLSTSALTGYWLRYSIANARWELYKQVASTATLLASYVPGTAVAVNDVHNGALYMIGNTLIVATDGAARLTLNDGAVTTAGKVGTQFGSNAATATTGMHLDNVRAA